MLPPIRTDPGAPALVLRDPGSLPAGLHAPVLALGNFDGVHRGHRGVIERARALGSRLGRPAGVLTFDPHPRRVFRPDAAHFALTPSPLRERLLQLAGAQAVILLTFDGALAGTSA